MRIGWIGLGAMGAPMARRLAAAGHDVTGYDVSGAARRTAGVPVAGSVRSAARDAAVLFVMVATPAQAREAVSGPDGALAALGPGAVVVVTATIGPDAMTELAGQIAAAGAAVIDAPVSGGTARAAAGDLLMMAAGGSDALARARPALAALASQLAVVGTRPGDGQRMKLVNQLLCGVHIAAAAEALALAGAIGLDPRQCWETLGHGAAASFMLADRGARMLAGDFGDVRSAADIFTKDMGLVTDAARRAGQPAPLAAAAGDLFGRATAAGLGRQDDAGVIRLYQEPDPRSGP
jgi:3-hydroxyisobutyrate dehydrogenase/putative dehydrogenase